MQIPDRPAQPAPTDGAQVPEAAAAAAAAVAGQVRFNRPGEAESEEPTEGTLAQLSRLGARARSRTDTGSREAKAAEVLFTPPTLPGVGSPLGEQAVAPAGSEDAKHMASQVLRGLAINARRTRPGATAKPADAAMVMAGFADASRALASAMERKAQMAGAARSNDL